MRTHGPVTVHGTDSVDFSKTVMTNNDHDYTTKCFQCSFTNLFCFAYNCRRHWLLSGGVSNQCFSCDVLARTVSDNSVLPCSFSVSRSTPHVSFLW